jgi:hypothetical protein
VIIKEVAERLNKGFGCDRLMHLCGIHALWVRFFAQKFDWIDGASFLSFYPSFPSTLDARTTC